MIEHKAVAGVYTPTPKQKRVSKSCSGRVRLKVSIWARTSHRRHVMANTTGDRMKCGQLGASGWSWSLLLARHVVIPGSVRSCVSDAVGWNVAPWKAPWSARAEWLCDGLYGMVFPRQYHAVREALILTSSDTRSGQREVASPKILETTARDNRGASESLAA